MSTETPTESASCAAHPDVIASWACGRCGTFMCPACERRMRPEARPMCPACWDLRTRTVNAPERHGPALPIIGLILGVLSLLPAAVLIQIVAVVVNIIAFGRTREPPNQSLRWMAIAGLALTGVGVVWGGIVAMMFVG
ncbi:MULTISPECIES: hypothetical protein [Myxococcus]|uniref:B box-type domain-containing protein n=1 Tax=Myxococcus llanfairpwllgwyngyllgogerychwyrndrobwllllantysiliogogogochensis TaxID=2590453 RepID=A0A540X891_9BACT|nr:MULTISPECIES: hypothetical protein [Myxococcus]NTX06314.1 hypothetical protein [Myxococcus sp. CA040A]TQF17368.1 hypothetical protein FJV41_03535 [Myxococcus llanfairpwllgwyngyllgogerychwyrndrobwllllantysiliogogogochensis]